MSKGSGAGKTILRNTAFSYISSGVQQLTGFLLLPILVGLTGKSEYGLYLLAASVPTFLYFLDFGMSGTIIKMVAPLRRGADWEALNRYVTCALLFRIVTATVIASCTLVLSAFAGDVFAVAEQDAGKLSLLMMVSAGFVLINWPLLLFQPVVMAWQRYEVISMVTLVRSIATFALAAGLTLIYRSVYATAFGLLSGNMLGNLYLFIRAKQLIPNLSVRSRFLDRNTFAEILAFGGKLFVTSVCGAMLYQLDRLVLGIYRGSASVTEYEVADTIHRVPRTAHMLSTSALMPAISELDRAGQREQIRNVVLHAAKYVPCVVYPIAIYFIVFAEPFVIWYMGDGFRSAVVTAQVFTAYWLVNAHSGALATALVGLGRLRLLLWYTVALLVLKVALSLLIVPSWGHLGAVASTSALYVVGFPLFAILALKELEIRFRVYASFVLTKHVAPLVATAAVAVLLLMLAVGPNFLSLAMAAVVVFAVYGGVFALLSTTRPERERLVGHLRSFFKG